MVMLPDNSMPPVPAEYIADFILTNSGNHNAYHNLRHAQHVCQAAWDATLRIEDNVDNVRRNSIVIAGLYHDWGHPGSIPTNDADNVARAACKVRELPEVPRWPFDREMASEAILGTVYPLPEGDLESLSDESFFLRDADIWHLAELSAWEFLKVQAGLAAEAGVPLSQWFEGNVGFLAHASTFTNWGKVRAKYHRQRLIDSCQNWAKYLQTTEVRP
jgi:hypothetical protein